MEPFVAMRRGPERGLAKVGVVIVGPAMDGGAHDRAEPPDLAVLLLGLGGQGGIY